MVKSQAHANSKDTKKQCAVCKAYNNTDSSIAHNTNTHPIPSPEATHSASRVANSSACYGTAHQATEKKNIQFV